MLKAKQTSRRPSPAGPDADPRRKAADAAEDGADSEQKKVRMCEALVGVLRIACAGKVALVVISG